LPHFLAIDLAIVRERDGSLAPRLIELQGFSSLYGMQMVQSGIWSEVSAGVHGALLGAHAGVLPGAPAQDHPRRRGARGGDPPRPRPGEPEDGPRLPRHGAPARGA